MPYEVVIKFTCTVRLPESEIIDAIRRIRIHWPDKKLGKLPTLIYSINPVQPELQVIDGGKE